MCVELTEGMLATLKDAAGKLTGAKRRAFQAQVTMDDLNGRPRQAERVFGWGRQTVKTGLHELRTGILRITASTIPLNAAGESLRKRSPSRKETVSNHQQASPARRDSSQILRSHLTQMRVRVT